MAIDDDSVDFLAGAESLSHGIGYLAMDGRHNASQPPGLAAMLAIFSLPGWSMETASAVLNGIALLAVMISSAWLVRGSTTTTSVLPGVIAVLAVGLCPVTVLPATVVWADAPLLGCTMAALALLQPAQLASRFGEISTSRAGVVGGLLGAAALFRYAGVISVVLVVVLLARRRRSDQAVAAAVAGLVPVSIWLLLNSRFGPPLGEHHSSAADPGEVLAMTGRALGGWFAPTQIVPAQIVPVQIVPVQIVVAILVAAAWIVLVWHGRRALSRTAGWLLGFAVTTATVLVLVRMRLALDDPDRLLAAVFPLVLIVTVAVITEALTRSSSRWPVMITTGLVTVSALLSWPTIERGASVPRHDELASLACTAPADAVLVSNIQAQIAYTCHRPVQHMPRAHPYGSSESVDDYPELRNRTENHCTWYLWSGPNRDRHFQHWPVIMAELDLTPMPVSSGQLATVGC